MRPLARCEYEWGVHVTFFAERAGLDTAQLQSLTHGAASDDMLARSASNACLSAPVDELYRNGDVDDQLWGELSGAFEEAGD